MKLPKQYSVPRFGVANYMVDVAASDLSAAAFQVFFFFWRNTERNTGEVTVSTREIARTLGMSRNTAAKGLRELIERCIVGVTVEPKFMVSNPRLSRAGRYGIRTPEKWLVGANAPAEKLDAAPTGHLGSPDNATDSTAA